MIRDKKDKPNKVEKILKAEISYVIRNYFDLLDSNIDIDISVRNNGMYHISIGADCRNIKSVSYIE